MADEYFDWVTALHDCDVREHFKKLVDEACVNVATHNERLGSTSFKVFWDPQKHPDVCTVARLTGTGGSVEFNLHDTCITIRSLSRDEVTTVMTLEVKLDEHGQCVLVRDGQRILRWHLLREVLGPLFGFEQ